MNKVVNHTYTGMIQDITKSKFSNEFYFEGKNIRIISTDSQSTGSITNEKGNKFILTIPKPVINFLNNTISYNSKILTFKTKELDNLTVSGDQVIIGQCSTRNYCILFTTDNNGFDCIWKVSYETYDITLLYLRDLEFSINNPIQAINNFENEKIDKVYWINGKSQVRNLNIEHSIFNQDLEEIIDIPLDTLQLVSSYDISQPLISKIEKGGIHTSGMIQYAYNLYRLNSSQTKLSPFSELISLDKDIQGGGILNEVVSSTPILNILNIDIDFTNIKIYSIKYNSLNELPIISLIKDLEIPSNRTLEIFDDGKIINTISLEEFLFLGSDIIIPKHINSKFNRLFLANYNELNFNIDIDTRAYSFNSNNQSKIYSELYLNGNIPDGNLNFTITTDLDYDSPILEKFDSVNLDYSTYKYQKNGITIGGEGKYIKYELTKELENDNNRFFKDDEIYRIGIQFYNKYSQVSLPSWIADFKAQPGNLSGFYNSLKVELKSEFFTWLNSNNFESLYDIPIGYKIVVAERTINDKTIVASGIISGMMVNDKSGNYTYDNNYKLNTAKTLPKLPNFLIRNCNETSDNDNCGVTRPLRKNLNLGELNRVDEGPDTEVQMSYYGDKDTAGRLWQFNNMFQLYSPEILFNSTVPLTNSLKIKVKGAFKNNFNAAWGKKFDTSNNYLDGDFKILNSISPFFGGNYGGGNSNAEAFSYGLISHPPDRDANKVNHMLFYREYGKQQTYINGQTYLNTITINNVFNHTLISNNDNSFEHITKKNINKEIDVYLDSIYSVSNITYEIIPDIGYTTETYSLKISSDIGGTNILDNINLITGTNIIDYDNTFVSTIQNPILNSSYYLIVESNNEFKFTVNVTVSLGDNTTPILLQKESLLNNYVINENVSLIDNFIEATPNTIDIYGTPELTELGQDFRSYNNDNNYRYTNSLQSVLTDGNSSWDEDGVYGRKVVSINSHNNRCITVVPGDDDSTIPFINRPSVESFLNIANINGDNNGLIVELIKSDIEIYLGNIYGGNTWEDKRRTNYIEIGNFKKIKKTDVSSINYIKSPGDTFVANFKFERISRTNQDILAEGIYQMCEIVNYLTETTIDLKNRSDISKNEWDIKFQPRNEEYHIYNNVYSQMSDLIKRRNINYNIKKINDFDTNIISSKLKTSGELIDSWTDILQNEVMTLDGKYGPINSLVNFEDELYTIQDKAFAFISISPRIQTQGSDGIAIQLGTGTILDKYKYLSTSLGTKNKWSVISSPKGIYFFDVLNKSINLFNGRVEKLSDLKLIHSFFINNVDETLIKLDNPLIKKGISVGYDFINNDMFMSFHQNDNSFTISFNENRDQFISFYDYIPSIYISKGDQLITTSPDLKNIYRQYYGNYNEYYGVKHPSHVVLNVNPESDKDCVFDNINFKSDVTLDNIDQIDKTITHITAYNDYQNVNKIQIPLIVGRNNNLRRKFRDWNALIPREGRNRIRAPYIKLKLDFENTMNYKLIFHDISVFYTTL